MIRRLTNVEMRQEREDLGLTPAELAELMEVDVSSVYKWERSPEAKTYRAPPARAERLLMAYSEGYRPGDWPERLRTRKPLPPEVRT